MTTDLPDMVTLTRSPSVKGKAESPATEAGTLINLVRDPLLIWQTFPFPLFVIW